MKYKPNIETVLKRYRAFWQKEVYDRPPIRIRYPIPGQSDEDWPAASQSPETYEPIACFSIFAQLSLRVTMRLTTGESAV